MLIDGRNRRNRPGLSTSRWAEAARLCPDWTLDATTVPGLRPRALRPLTSRPPGLMDDSSITTVDSDSLVKDADLFCNRTIASGGLCFQQLFDVLALLCRR